MHGIAKRRPCSDAAKEKRPSARIKYLNEHLSMSSG
jgi:hypothetical protein